MLRQRHLALMRLGAGRAAKQARRCGRLERLQAFAIEAMPARGRALRGFGPALLRLQRLRQIDGFVVLGLIDEIGHADVPDVPHANACGLDRRDARRSERAQDSIAASQRTKLIASTTRRLFDRVFLDAVAGAAPGLG
ncbi:hypothetical protein [Lysobacter enzymogenes]|uniref:hypothetical protein n=1 Tax=Lysobacter enzymogenes TaxID=69 RepID=UPI001A9638ED|nr:hypothetical protein [Lysobacter enzymogenes]QQP94313.1 hypothetical protein JHW38_13635 [Lysobacter enzymogenes]